MQSLSRSLWLLILHLSLAAGLFAQVPDISVLPGSSKFDFVAYGDIRFTNASNTRDSDPAARQALVGQIADLKPPFLLITGDLVLKGGDADDWKVWEKETGAWRTAGIQVFPVLGNHELRGDPKAIRYFSEFPVLKEHRWYTLRAGNALFFMLDSESDAVGGEEWNWLEHQLNHVPDDVDFLFFALHHPPYTHSTDHMLGGGHSERPTEEKLAAMLEQRQAMLRQRIIVLSGHVHNYERYEHGGVTYLVSGGGGATPYKVPRSPQDFYRESGPTYHFIHFFVDGQKLRAEVVKQEIQNGKPSWTVIDKLQLQAPAAKKVAAR